MAINKISLLALILLHATPALFSMQRLALVAARAGSNNLCASSRWMCSGAKN